MPSRKELVEAAKELNALETTDAEGKTSLIFDDLIDVSSGVDVLKKDILEGCGLLNDSEKELLSESTRKVVDELQAPPATEKVKSPKVAKATKPPKAEKAPKAAKAAKEPAAAKERKPRALRAGSGTVGDFKPVRAGTKYEALLKMIDKKSVDAIAEHYKVSRTDILWFFRYPLRKHGIDHKIDDKGMISLVLPSGKTAADCVASAS